MKNSKHTEERKMADIRDSKNWGFETKQLHIGQEKADPVTDARAVPIYASTSYVFHNSQHAADRFGLRDAGNIYGRLTNPTEDVFEQRIAALEGGVAALAVASGAAAINYTFQALAKTGEHIVASKTIYGGTYNLLAHTLPKARPPPPAAWRPSPFWQRAAAAPRGRSFPAGRLPPPAAAGGCPPRSGR